MCPVKSVAHVPGCTDQVGMDSNPAGESASGGRNAVRRRRAVGTGFKMTVGRVRGSTAESLVPRDSSRRDRIRFGESSSGISAGPVDAVEDG